MSDVCLRDLYNYKLQNVQPETAGYDYHTLTSVPFDSWSESMNTSVFDCRNVSVASTDVCVVAKGTFSASRIYLWTAQPTLTNALSFMQAYGASYAVGRSVYSSAGMAVGNFDTDEDASGFHRIYGDVILGNRLFLSSLRPAGAVLGDYSHSDGLRIGSRPFSKVWAGDLDGVHPDDVVGKHEDDGSVVVYLGYLDSSGRLPSTPAGLGFRYGGELVSKDDAVEVNTISFVSTIAGYGTDCREGGVFGCITYQKAIFVGTGDRNNDMIWTTAQSAQPFRTAFVNTGAQPCPMASNGVDVTLPVKSYLACVSAAKMLVLQQPTPDSVERVHTLSLPLHACVVINNAGKTALNAEFEIVFNEGSTPEDSNYSQELRDFPWAHNDESIEVNHVCLQPEASFQRFAPPAPPNQKTQRFKVNPVSSCGSLRDPCRCCRAYQRDDAGHTIDCVAAATGTLWSVPGSETGAVCRAYDLSSTAPAANCEEILPYCDDQSVSKVFQPLQGSMHNTLSSTSFFTDVNQQYQAIVVGTAAGSANNLVYLAHADVNRRELTDTIDEESVDVAAVRISGSFNLICFAVANAPNRCIRIGIDPSMKTWLPDLSGTTGISTANARRKLGDSTCDYVMVDNGTAVDPWKHSTPGAAPLWPYPLGEIARDETSGDVISTLTWEQCLDRCRETPGCVYVYWPENCGNTWTGRYPNIDFSTQCFMFSSYHPDPASNPLFQGKPSTVTKWVSDDWCQGNRYKHAYSSCYNSEFDYQTHTFGDALESTSSVELRDLNKDGYIDLVTLANSGYMRIYRGTAQTQNTGNFNLVIPETVRASFANQAEATVFAVPPPPTPPVHPNIPPPFPPPPPSPHPPPKPPPPSPLLKPPPPPPPMPPFMCLNDQNYLDCIHKCVRETLNEGDAFYDQCKGETVNGVVMHCVMDRDRWFQMPSLEEDGKSCEFHMREGWRFTLYPSFYESVWSSNPATGRRRTSNTEDDAEAEHPFPEIARRVRARKLLTSAPGGATGADHMPSHAQLEIFDIDQNGFEDIITHSPGRSAGDCAMRCRKCYPHRTNDSNHTFLALWRASSRRSTVEIRLPFVRPGRRRRPVARGEAVLLLVRSTT